ncbi:MAG: lamin tail domain-containing protein [Flavobacteriia bacterium]|nr:lamin tail domain-containing protein [Flavobacteriia bacterium]
MIRLKNFMWLAVVGVLIGGCETNDVEPDPTTTGPSVSLSANTTNMSEDNGSIDLTVSLSEPLTSDVIVDLAFGGDATEGVDYNVSSATVTIGAGALTGTTTFSAIQDTAEEANEVIRVQFASVMGANFNSNEELLLLIEDDDAPLSFNLIINEICYDPSNNALDGDANGDGVYVQDEDEFIEFVNLSSQTIDMGGYKIYDTEALTAGTPRHEIPANTLVPPGKALVVFGGGTPTGTFGNAIVQTASDGRINMNNSGDLVTLTDAAGNVILTFDIEPLSNNPNESYTRNPDLTGQFEQHGTNTGVLFSPGTKIDGSPF